jgi:hypothetical protein
MLSVGNMMVAVNKPEYFNEFALPSIVYFLIFSVLEIKLLFLIWKSQNLDLLNIPDTEASATLMRKRLFRFYSFLCKIYYFIN